MKKSQIIYEYIRKQGFASKQDIVIDLKLSLPTITQNLQYLVDLGVVDTSRKIENTGGRNAIAYSYMECARYALGVYLTAHHINVIAVDLSGNVAHKQRVRIDFNLEQNAYLKRIGHIIENVKSAVGISDDQLLGVGIAVPSLVSEDGELVSMGITLNFTGKTRKEIAKYIPYKSRLFHDSAAAGYAETWIDQELENVFYISLNNSVGGAVVIDHSVYQGDTHKSGEIGHMTIVPENGQLCYCGKRGCLDTVCRCSRLEEYAEGNLEKFFELLEHKDEGAVHIWDEYMNDLALAINNIRVLFDSTIVIGGYVGAYMDEYIPQLRAKVDERNPFGDKAENYLIPCKYKVESAAAGAAIYFIDEFFRTI